MTVRVGVVDDQPLIRTGLRTMIDHAADLELVGEAADGEQAVELARRQRPDVVLMDIRMPVLDGIEATRRITADAELAGVRVVMLTTFDVDDYVHAAIRAGASGFLLKDAPPEDVLDAIRVVARGDALLAPSVTRRIIEELAARPDPDRAAPPQLDILTDREREVLTPGRTGPVERRDRRPALRQPGHRQDPRQPRDDEALRPRPGAARRDRLRERSHPPRGVARNASPARRRIGRRLSPSAQARRSPPSRSEGADPWPPSS